MNDYDGSKLVHSVVIVTWRRPSHVSSCLNAIARGSVIPDEVVLVDASEDERTQQVVAGIPYVVYLRFPGGAGNMTAARNEGLQHVRGDLVSFLDDDVRPGFEWAAAVQATSKGMGVAAVAGRVTNGRTGEDSEGADAIGQFRPDGTLTGFFAADPGGIIDVDHGIGANMSFRREWLARLGGFRDVFPGTAMREDTDVFLRMRSLNGRVVFDPKAVAANDSGPHVVGRRFDLRYAAYGEHNHMVLLVLNFGTGFGSPTWRYLAARIPTLLRDDPQRRWSSRIIRSIMSVVALFAGVGRGVVVRRTARGSVLRSDSIGEAIRTNLGLRVVLRSE